MPFLSNAPSSVIDIASPVIEISSLASSDYLYHRLHYLPLYCLELWTLQTLRFFFVSFHNVHASYV